MHDPIAVPATLFEFTRPYAEALHLSTLPLHIHEVLISYVFYISVEKMFSPWLSTFFFPDHYPKLNRRTKINWDIHFTSFVQSILICTAVFTVMIVDKNRIGDTWEERIWGYTGAAGLAQAMATGYFMWDLMVCVLHVKLLGPLDLIHGLSAVPVAFLGFRPFALYYGIAYLLFELSTPCVNVHWFLDKIDMTGTSIQLYNGIILISTFFCCRLVYGSYLSFVFFTDMWSAFNETQLITTKIDYPTADRPLVLHHALPFWFGPLFLLIDSTLMALNFYWFFKMIEAVRKRFRPAPEDSVAEKSPSKSTHSYDAIANGKVKAL